METKAEDKEVKRYERKPNFDLRAKLSRDGRYWIFERTETWILPVNYLAVIHKNHALAVGSENAKATEQPKRKGKRDADRDGQGN